MKNFKTKPTEDSRPNESHILFFCSDDANSTCNTLLLNSPEKTSIQLRSGWCLLTLSEYPGLKYGFRPAMLKHHSVAELNPNCQSVLEADLSHFDASHVISTERMFFDMANLKSVDLSNVKFSHVTKMDKMFSRCLNLENIIQNKFDTFYSRSLTSASAMFYSTIKLKRLALPYLVHSGVKNVEDIFLDMEALEILDISGWNLRGVKIGNCGSTEAMFENNSRLEKVYAIGCNEYTRSKLSRERERDERRYPRFIFALNIQK